MAQKFPELSYANPDDPPVRRFVIRSLESLSGRDYFAPHYERWRSEIVPRGKGIIRPMLRLIDVELEIRARAWPPKLDPARPLVLIANHPFGILDGIAALTIAEDLGRPFKVLINQDLMKVPEIRPFSLPISFDETRAAQATNIATRKEALRLLAAGTTIVIFPAGGVATARNPLGQAIDLPWKGFVARLVQSARSSVLPVYFEGQCGPMFHAASRLSLTLRLSMLIREFRRSVGSKLVAHVGGVLTYEALEHRDDRRQLLAELHELVHRLSDRALPPPEDGVDI